MSHPQPLSESDLIFPTASTSIKTTLLSLKRNNLSISNRLRSIAADGTFVSKVAATFKLPLVANERCGSWYIDPKVKGGSAYFKSTDGHFGEWSFSLRRLNLGVLEVVGREGGCIIVDSTRRGKSMPDALSKTVGIWIVVLNRLLFDHRPDSHELMTPSDVVSGSEHAQIDERLDRFVEEARRLDLNLEELRAKVKKPMRPYWVTPATSLDTISTPSDRNSFATVVLCTASSKPSVEARNDPDYVQGAADDHEAWSCGLTAPVFWRNSETLLATSEDELPAKIAELVALSTNAKDASLPALIKPTTSLFIGDESTIEQASLNIDVLVYCGLHVDPAIRKRIESRGGRVVHLSCTGGKNGSRQLRTSLQNLEDLQRIVKAEPKILVAGQDDKDMAVGAALAIVCSFVAESGKLDYVNRQSTTNKAEIKKRLSWIIVSKPDAAPSRATLQSVNSYLMG